MPPRAKPAAPSSRQVISRQLREVIRARGLTAYALGRRADVDPGIIQRFLNEERDIKLDTLDRLADVLGLRLAEGSRGRGRPARPAKADRSAAIRADQGTDLGPSQAPPEVEPGDRARGEPQTPAEAEPSTEPEAETAAPVAPPAAAHWWES